MGGTSEWAGPGRSTASGAGCALPGSGTFLLGDWGNVSKSTFRHRRLYFPRCTAASLFLFRSRRLRQPRVSVSDVSVASDAIRR